MKVETQIPELYVRAFSDYSPEKCGKHDRFLGALKTRVVCFQQINRIRYPITSYLLLPQTRASSLVIPPLDSFTDHHTPNLILL